VKVKKPNVFKMYFKNIKTSFLIKIIFKCVFTVAQVFVGILYLNTFLPLKCLTIKRKTDIFAAHIHFSGVHYLLLKTAAVSLRSGSVNMFHASRYFASLRFLIARNITASNAGEVCFKLPPVRIFVKSSLNKSRIQFCDLDVEQLTM
jgi:hypothetical protein